MEVSRRKAWLQHGTARHVRCAQPLPQTASLRRPVTAPCVAMERVFPVILAAEVYQFLEWAHVLCVCRVSASVRRAYEAPALQLVKVWVRQASGRLGYHRIRVHPTSVVHNVYKLWRRTIAQRRRR